MRIKTPVQMVSDIFLFQLSAVDRNDGARWAMPQMNPQFCKREQSVEMELLDQNFITK